MRRPGDVRSWGVDVTDGAEAAVPGGWADQAATLPTERINHGTLRTNENSPF